MATGNNRPSSFTMVTIGKTAVKGVDGKILNLRRIDEILTRRKSAWKLPAVPFQTRTHEPQQRQIHESRIRCFYSVGSRPSILP